MKISQKPLTNPKSTNGLSQIHNVWDYRIRTQLQHIIHPIELRTETQIVQFTEKRYAINFQNVTHTNFRLVHYKTFHTGFLCIILTVPSAKCSQHSPPCLPQTYRFQLTLLWVFTCDLIYTMTPPMAVPPACSVILKSEHLCERLLNSSLCVHKKAL